jgi:benzodiazapine receptor
MLNALYYCYYLPMKASRTSEQYVSYEKPNWAPPSWIFGPVWTMLYILIAISFGYVIYVFLNGHISFFVLLPFLLNLLFNIAYTFIQFRLRNFVLASLDVLLVLATLVWALVAIYPSIHWVSYVNIPYLMWVIFATVLQLTVTSLNRN